MKRESAVKALTAAQMREIEAFGMDAYKIPSLILMENAARSVAEKADITAREMGFGCVAVFCGTGNNGGDGLACARLLRERDYKVSVIYVGNREKASKDNKLHLEIVLGMGIETVFSDDDLLNTKKLTDEADMIIDALLGTGLKSAVRENYNKIIKIINNSGKYVLSVDIPSGIDSDSGMVMGSAVKAHATIALSHYKIGNAAGQGPEYNGNLSCMPIGMPYDFLKIWESKAQAELRVFLSTEELCADILPKRKSRSNKGDYGRTAVIAGCETMPGACLMACESAYKCGSGIVKAMSVKEVIHVIQHNLKEAVTVFLESEGGFVSSKAAEKAVQEVENASSVVIGPGFGNNETTKAFLKEVLPRLGVPTVLDADALNIISNDLSILVHGRGNWILTPHPGEMARLTGIDVEDILKNPVKYASDFSEKYNVVTVLKDARTVIAGPDKSVFINTSGNASMAKGGSGDVLAGIIGGFLAQGISNFDAAVLGCFIHGRAGEISSSNLGMYSPKASDIIANIPYAIKEITG